MSSSRLSRTAFDLGYSGKGDFDKWLRQRVKDEDLHSSLVRELRREYSRGRSERISQDKFKAEAAYLKAHKRDEKAPPIPEGEKASDQNLEYKGHLIKRTTTGWDVLGESGWGSLSDAKQYVDLYVMTGGKVKRKNACKPSAKARFKVARKTAEKRVTAAAKALQGKRNPKFSTIKDVLREQYSVTLDRAPVEAILWSAGRIAQHRGAAEAVRQLASVNRERERLGKARAYPSQGDPLYSAWLGKGKRNAGKKSIRKSKKEARKRMGLKNPTATLKQGDSVAYVVEMGTNSYSAQIMKKGGERESRDFKGRGAFNAAMSWARLRLHEVANPCSYRLFKEKPKGRRNPEDASVRMYEKFHGIPSEEVREYVEEEHRHSWLAGLGPLISMVVMNVQGNKDVLLEFPDPLDNDATEVVMLCVTEDGNQLVCVGGDQELPEKFLIDKFGMTPTDFNRDNALIGTIKQITYRTKKKFEKDGTEEIDFFHDLGGEGSRGVYPVLEYKTRSPRCVIVGGRYYVGKYEPSIGASPGVIG